MTEVFNWRSHLPVHPAAELFPLMAEADLKELAADIKANGGLCSPPVMWPNSDKRLLLVDGRNRLDALALLGLLGVDESGCLTIETARPAHFQCAQGADPYAVVLSQNVHRRHLTPEQKRDLIAKLVKAKPDLSDRQLGKMAKASKNTVASVRTDLELRGQVDHVEKRKDTKGRKQPAKKTKPAAATIEADADDAATSASAMKAKHAAREDDGARRYDFDVEYPEQIKKNILDTVDNHCAVVRAYKKNLKVSSPRTRSERRYQHCDRQADNQMAILASVARTPPRWQW